MSCYDVKVVCAVVDGRIKLVVCVVVDGGIKLVCVVHNGELAYA